MQLIKGFSVEARGWKRRVQIADSAESKGLECVTRLVGWPEQQLAEPLHSMDYSVADHSMKPPVDRRPSVLNELTELADFGLLLNSKLADRAPVAAPEAFRCDHRCIVLE